MSVASEREDCLRIWPPASWSNIGFVLLHEYQVVLLAVTLTYSPKDSLSRLVQRSWQTAATHARTHAQCGQKYKTLCLHKK
jgi:hypothetical protein